MIPPLPQARLRSIQQWLKDNPQEAAKLPEAPANRAESLDALMIEAFETREDSLKDAMIRDKTWATQEGIQSFPLARMQLWQEVVAEFLPPTSGPSSED